MSNALIKAADDARRLLRGFRAFEEVAQALELAGTAEQSRVEAEAAIAKLRPELEKLQAEIGEAHKVLTETKAKSEQLSAAARLQADEIVRAAREHAKELQANADQYVREALAAADAKVAEADGQVLVAQAKRDDLAGEVKDLEAKIEKLRAQAAKILG